MVGYAPSPGILDLLMVMECSIKVSEEDDSLLEEEPLLSDEEELLESIKDDSLEEEGTEDDSLLLQPVRTLMDRMMPSNSIGLRMKDSFLTIIFQRQRDMIA